MEPLTLVCAWCVVAPNVKNCQCVGASALVVTGKAVPSRSAMNGLLQRYSR